MPESRMRDSLFAMMVIGFGCICVIGTACSFPLILMSQSDQAGYRMFNLSQGLSATIAGLLYVIVIIKGNRRVMAGIAALGYVLLAVGLLVSGSVHAGIEIIVPCIAGIACGAGLAVTSIFWFGLITFLQERKAILVLGYQVFFGSAVFIIIALLNRQITSELDIVICLISAFFAYASYSRITSQNESSFVRESFRSSLQVFNKQRVFVRVLVIPIVGFILIAFTYGIIEAVAMGVDGSPYGEIASISGIPLGALVFLLWINLSRKRDYGLAIKAIFIILLAVFWIPAFDATVLMMSMGFQVSALLLYSLLIDELSSHKGIALLLMAISYACMRLFSLIGLYIPGFFGIPSYSMYFESTSLLMFLVYLVFIILLILSYRELKIERQNTEAALLRAIEAQENTANVLQGAFNDTTYAYEQIAHRFGLTKRETEVLSYFARGRDVSFICDELYLSRNTVKGYTKRIYTKLGIHSKQELIDIVESVEKIS